MQVSRRVVMGVAVLALGARLALLRLPASFEMDLSYAVARHWGADPSNVIPPYSLQSALWWQRPLSYALLGPAAAMGFTAFRVAVALATSFLPPLVTWATLRGRANPYLAAVAGAAGALPWFAQAATDAWPVALAATFGLGAVLAYASGRPALSGALALAAAWSHPAGILAAAGLLAAAAVRGGARAYPLDLDEAATAAAAALLLGALPAATSWLLLGGAAVVATWTWAGAIVAAAVVLAPALLVGGALAPKPARVPVLAVAWGGIIALTLLPAADPGIGGAMAAMGPPPWDSVLLVDVDWRLVPHPFADHAGVVGWSYTAVPLPADDWIHAIEGSSRTVLHKEPRSLNVALRLAYLPCTLYEDRLYVVLDGACTPGHGDGLRQMMEGPD